MDANFIQQRMGELQKSQDFSNTFSKLVSGGRYGYQTIIEKESVILKCKHCQAILDASQKFCMNAGQGLRKNKKLIYFLSSL